MFFRLNERGFLGGEKILSEKEILFCRNYCNCLNLKESAIKAGYPVKKAEKIGQKLLAKKEIALFLKKLENEFEKEKIFKLAITALRRMILYRSNDAINLANCFGDISKEEIEKLDLFQISELKKFKDGSFEFKFINRIKAIETLLTILEKMENKTQVNGFLKALTAKPAYCDDD